MKVALIGATGNAGTRILKELLSRGHEVIAVARNVGSLDAQPGVTVKAADADDPEGLADAIRGADVAISALKFAHSDPEKLIAAVRAAGIRRYLVVGGAGTLTPPGSNVKIIDSGTLPETWMPEVGGGARFLERLKKEPEGLDWTFQSPSMTFGAGERTGKFRLGKDELLVGEDGKSFISYEDYAIAMVDEIEQPRHVRQRFTVGY